MRVGGRSHRGLLGAVSRPTADERYTDPDWERFRHIVDAWDTLGGAESLAAFCRVSVTVVESWRLGVTTPPIAMRDAACEWMIKRATAPARARARGTR